MPDKDLARRGGPQEAAIVDAEPPETQHGDMGLAIRPVIDLDTAKQRLAELQRFVKFYLREGEDYGVIPGTEKPTLYKPGADKLRDIYGLADSYELLDKVEDFERGLFDYTVRCTLTSKRNGAFITSGLGSCNSFEERYAYRKGARVCPKCKSEAIIKGKQEYGGGFICWQKKGGCGAKFKDGDQTIESQNVDRVRVAPEFLATVKNTVLKLAKKRASVDATLSATRSSGIFTQDMEDIKGEPPDSHEEEPPDLGQDTPKPKALISQAQQKKLFATARAAGWKEAEIKEALKKKFGVEHSNEIPAERFNDVLAFFERGDAPPAAG